MLHFLRAPAEWRRPDFVRKRVRIAKIVGRATAFVLVALWWWMGSTENHYLIARPRNSQPEIGCVVPFHTGKGVTVYVSSLEGLVFKWVVRVEIGAGIIVFVSLLVAGAESLEVSRRR
jgi:hypothetical protein